MKMRSVFLFTAAALTFAAASVHAQTVQLAIAGLPELYDTLAEASFASQGCFFYNNIKGWNLSDTRFAPAIVDTAAAWVTWTAGGGTCPAPGAGSVIDFYISVDSVTGDRCFFASPSCAVSTNAAFNPNCGPPLRGITCTNLPPAIQNAINNAGNGTRVNVASTDLRPEDALFGTIRAFWPCGVPLVPGSQYLGLGLQKPPAGANINQGTPVNGAAWNLTGFVLPGGIFNFANFAIMGNDPVSGLAIANGTGNGWVVTTVGATPVVLFVNPSDGAGLGSLAVGNVNRAQLSGILDSTYGAAQALVPQNFFGSGEVGVNTMLREPVSGTYSVIEHAIANNIENQSSQDVGVAAVFAPGYCTGAAFTGIEGNGPTWSAAANANPLQETNGGANATWTRSRVIGVQNMVTTVENVKDALGYALWSQANFSGATPGNAKYLTVDGVDPIQEVWSDGEVPTTANGLICNISFTHVRDGSYPIWTFLRLVSSAASSAAVSALANAAQKFVTPDFPDFAVRDQLSIVRSHFSPPRVTYPGNGGSPSNGDISGGVEAGGDVAGMVYSIQGDNDYAANFAQTSGNVAHRQ